MQLKILSLYWSKTDLESEFFTPIVIRFEFNQFQLLFLVVGNCLLVSSKQIYNLFYDYYSVSVADRAGYEANKEQIQSEYLTIFIATRADFNLTLKKKRIRSEAGFKYFKEKKSGQ